MLIKVGLGKLASVTYFKFNSLALKKTLARHSVLIRLVFQTAEKLTEISWYNNKKHFRL